MLRLYTLGGLSIARDQEVLETSRVRKPLAVLGALAAVPAGLSRERLTAMFWPESDETRAKGALKQAQYLLRQLLGEDPFAEQGSNLQLNRAVVWCDLHEFGARIDANDPRGAVTLHKGPFLDGVHMGETHEFDELVARERVRVGAQYAAALECLAERAATTDKFAAADWWRRRGELDPYSGRVARAYMLALVDAGERERALAHGKRHAEIVKEELGADADVDVVALIDALKADDRPATPLDARVITPAEGTPSHVRTKSRWMRLSLAAAAITLLVWGGARVAGSSERDDSEGTVAIFPFALSAQDTSLAYLREGIADLLASRVRADPGPRALDIASLRRRLGTAWRSPETVPVASALAAAKASGSQFAVLGRIASSANQLTIRAQVLAVSNGASIEVTEVTGPVDSLAPLVNRLAGRIGLVTVGEPEWRFEDFNRRSLPTLRAYMLGRHLLREGQNAPAGRAFYDALERDSTFALAGLGMAEAGVLAINGDSAGIAPLRRRIIGLRDRLGARDKLLFDVLVRPDSEPRRARSEFDAWRRANDALPERAEGWFEVGDRLFHEGRRLGEPDWLERAAAAFRGTIERDPAMLQAQAHLVEAAVLNGPLGVASRCSETFAAAERENPVVQFTRWLVAACLADANPAARTKTDFSAMAYAAQVRVVAAAQRYGLGGGDIAPALAALSARAREGTERFATMALTHHYALNRGDSLTAARVLGEMAGENRAGRAWNLSWISTDHQAVLDAVLWGGSREFAGAAAKRITLALRDSASQAADVRAASRSVLALWSLSRGGAEEASRLMSERVPAQERDALSYRVADLAYATATGDSASVRRKAEVVDSLIRQGPYEFGTEFAPIVLARAWMKGNNQTRAILTLERRSNDWIPSTAFLRPVLQLELEVIGDGTARPLKRQIERQLAAMGRSTRD